MIDLVGRELVRAAETLDVDFPERTIELIVAPYDQEIEVPVDGRTIRESFAPGAFDGIERRANRVRVNREHKRELTFGRAVAFYPKRPEGLVAKIKVARTVLGDEALELAHDQALDASAGFQPRAIEWLDDAKTRVRYVKAWLGHIALTPDPAYDGARVLSVRAAQPARTHGPTPNLDVVRGWRLEDLVASDPALRS